jgi:ergothioneine biosynthesis protein EgtB
MYINGLCFGNKSRLSGWPGDRIDGSGEDPVKTIENPAALSRSQLTSRYNAVRQFTEQLCRPLATEDYVVQPIEDVSPPKWHLAHTTWFFEQVVLERFVPAYRRYHDTFYFIFNSYYQAFGDRASRDLRGTLSRPTVEQVYAYRAAIDRRVRDLIESIPEDKLSDVAALIELGLHHEQQHQELLVTDIKYIFASNPLLPLYTERRLPTVGSAPPAEYVDFTGGTREIGCDGADFAYDCEGPRHTVYVAPFSLMNRLVTCGEYLDFMEDGGYTNPDLWLSNGWDVITSRGWRAPLFWVEANGGWQIITMSGIREVSPAEPVCHVCHYEAEAYARWAGKRLPTEAEWEVAAQSIDDKAYIGNFVEEKYFHPAPAGTFAENHALRQMFGDVWEWTSSAFLPYPGYRREPGALGEYNGKFMNDQTVLRGGSCATSRSHLRPTYRNFFQSDRRWQFTGFRLAADA